jgi:hypothetical protein
MFLFEHFAMLSGGALGALTVGLATCLAWEAGRPRRLSLGPSLDYSADIERYMARIWDLAAEPMLFGTIGATFRFDTLPPGTIPRAVLIVCCGVVLRMGVTFLTMMGRPGYTWRERVFYAVAWTPKATVQVRFCLVLCVSFLASLERAACFLLSLSLARPPPSFPRQQNNSHLRPKTLNQNNKQQNNQKNKKRPPSAPSP